MGAQVDYPIVGSFNNQRITNIDAERSVNVFEYIDPLGKKNKCLIFTSGIEDTEIVFTGASGGARGEFVLGNSHFIVFGSNIYRIDNSNVAIKLNTNPLNSSVGYVGIDANQAEDPQVIFVDGVNGYIYDTIAGTFTMITDTGFPAKPIDVCFLDGYFIVAYGDTNDFRLSQFNQGLVWSGSGLENFTADATTDTITIPGGTANFATGVDIQLVGLGKTSNTFTASTSTNYITPAGGTVPYGPTGSPISVKPGTSGVLPSPLSPNSVYWTIIIDGTNLQLAATEDDANNNKPIVLSNNGTPPNNIISTTSLPVPLKASTTYYVINTGPNTIQLASSFANAQAGIPIDILTTGTPPNQIENNGELQQASILSHPGTIVACRTLHRRLFLFSQNFTEVWENAGAGTNLPFRRNNSLLMEVGTPSIASIATGFDKMFFLSQDKDGLGSVMQVEGSQSFPVSTRALDYQLAQYANNPDFLIPGVSTGVTDARGIMIKENGIIFYRLNFTTANHTYVYNVTFSDPSSDQGKLWHEEEILNGDRHPAQTHGYFNGKNYYGDYNTPILYEVDNSLPTNNGETIRRMRIGKAIVPGGYQRTRIDRFHLDLQQGQPAEDQFVFLPIELLSEDGLILETENAVDILLEDERVQQINNDNPKVFLSISKDGGQSYGYKQEAPMGRLGERTFRTVWRKLGTIPRGQAFVPKIEFFGQGPFIILGAAWVSEIMPE